jgi:hypothetical protein
MIYDHREHYIINGQRHADLLAISRLEERARCARARRGRANGPLAVWLGTQLIVLGERLKEGRIA